MNCGELLISQRYLLQVCFRKENSGGGANPTSWLYVYDAQTHPLSGHSPHVGWDHAVTAGLKKIPGVPLLYIILNTIVLDKPSQTSLNHVQAVQLGELVTPAQQQSIRSLKEEQGIKDGERRGKKRKRKQSNPNPLSCLKKKKKGGPTPSLKKTEPGEKRKRSRHKRRKAAGGDDTAAPAVSNT
ncbi:hypothetical protein GOODEAATRI_017407 [Goodea atripinnis]|uniref:UTP23 sensor motif region domain-containing protein n=1 Tax=Goodea atripinnis TaxID=208336 RepID=A0ABV0PET8_9TELE